MSRDWQLYLDDIVESCRRVLTYAEGLDYEQFLADHKTYDAILRNIEIVGEAAKHLPEEARVLMPEIEWAKAAGLRDFLAHAYFGLDNAILWDVIRNKIPELLRSANRLQQSLNGG